MSVQIFKKTEVFLLRFYKKIYKKMPTPSLSPQTLLYGYENGLFPMAEEDQTVYWYSPDPRAIIPLEAYRPAHSLRPVLNRHAFEIKINTAFAEVVHHCARPRFAGDGTWISDEIMTAYTALHRLGMAHSVETWQQGQLAGGLYGVALGGAFFGESMFYHCPNASKIAFHFLVEILRRQGFSLLDTQFINANVARFGAIEISREAYLFRLKVALQQRCRFAIA